MKKNFLIIVCLVVFLTACGKKRILYCTAESEMSGYSISLSYQIEHDGKYVSRLKSVEKVSSVDGFILSSFEQMINDDQEKYKDLKYYKYSTEIKDDVLTGIVDINYKKVNTVKMINLDSNNQELIKNGKVSIDDIKLYYEDLGTTCYE